MKQMISLLLLIAFLFCFAGCEKPEQKPDADVTDEAPTVTDPTQKDVAQDIGVEAKWIWDTNSTYNPNDVLVLDVLPEEEVTVEGVSVFVNGKLHSGAVQNLYTADFTGDGYPELCLTVSVGSGLLDWRIYIYDFKIDENVFELSDRGDYDYQLFLRNGILCVKQTECMEDEVLQTGVLTRGESGICVVWDNEILLGESANK